MKKIGLLSLRAYISLGLFFYFKKIRVHKAQPIPNDQAVLYLPNHQNALLDALLIATKSGRLTHFLTRASVFNNEFIGTLLRSLLMLPVYRVRDGWSNISKNNDIFKTCGNLMHERKAIAVFPEGSHNLKRTVRPLSKGFTRIITETFQISPQTPIHLVPVGLNFVDAEHFSDSVFINFGAPIQVSSEHVDGSNESIVQLKNNVHSQLCQLTTHIEAKNYSETLAKLERLNVDFLNPQAVNDCVANNFRGCETSNKKSLSVFKRLFKFLLIISLIVPYVVWKKGLQPNVKEIEFISTFRFAVAISLVPFFIVLIMICLTIFMSFSWAIGYLIAVLSLALLAVKL